MRPPAAPHTWLIAAAIGGLMSVAAPAWSQARVAIELQAEGAVPVSPAARSVVTLTDVRRVDGVDRGTPYLSDHWTSPSGNLSLGVRFGETLLRYTFQRASWSHETIRCVSAPPRDQDAAVLLPTGEIDDAEVDYDCSALSRATLPEGLAPLVLHHASVLRRFPVYEVEPFTVLATVGGGATLTSYRPGDLVGGLRAGPHVYGAATLEWELDRGISLLAETGYRFYVLADPTPTDAAAHRAQESGRGIWSAMLDGGHAITASIGVRVFLQ